MTPTHATSSEVPSSSPGSAQPSSVPYGAHVVRPVKPDHSVKIILGIAIIAFIAQMAILYTQTPESNRADQAWLDAHPQHQNFIRNTEILHILRDFLAIFRR